MLGRGIRTFLTLVALVACFAVPFAPDARAQEPTLPSPAELERFFDGLIGAYRQTYQIPGATLAVAQGGTLLFSKGYGAADVEKSIPVDPTTTLFRIGSVSKLFVWTAVMQLVEEGRLSLDADVNTYLTDFKITPTFDQPITLAHLMTHTAGFEEQIRGLFLQRPEDLMPLPTYLTSHQPARVRPPGQITAYSNYGASLAGYIVSQVDGRPFDQYVNDRILQPLGMTRSTFQQPLPAELAAAAAVGYAGGPGAPAPRGFEIVQSAPAGAMSASAVDIARFMSAHLQGGSLDGAQILRPETAQRMHTRLFSNDPRVSGIAHGFLEAQINGRRVLWHGGDTIYFHSNLVLIPELNLGYFLSYNGERGAIASLEAMNAFVNLVSPAPAPNRPDPTATYSGVGQYAGAYQPARANFTTSEKLLTLFQMLAAQPLNDRDLLLTSGFPPQPLSAYWEVEPEVFRSLAVPPHVLGDVVFRADGREPATYVFQSNNPTTGYLRAPWYLSSGFQFPLIGLVMLMFASVLGWLPIGLWMRRRYHSPLRTGERLASVAALLLSAAGLMFVVLVLVLFSNPVTIFEPPGWWGLVRALPWAIAACTVAAGLFMLVGWWRRYWSLPGRLHYTLVTLAGVAFVWWLALWNQFSAQ